MPSLSGIPSYELAKHDSLIAAAAIVLLVALS
jgi:hypothetical protein